MKLPEIEITLKYKGAKQSELTTINSSSSAAKVFRQLFNDGTLMFNEEFVMLCMNRASKCIGYYKVSKGGTTATIADIKIIATIALQSAASQIMIAHNHPSGSIKPSQMDKQLTAKVKEGLQLLDIELLDHIILTDEKYFSFADEGLLYNLYN